MQSDQMGFTLARKVATIFDLFVLSKPLIANNKLLVIPIGLSLLSSQQSSPLACSLG